MSAILRCFYNKLTSKYIFRNYSKTQHMKIYYDEALREAEKLVGCSTPLLNMTWLLNNEMEILGVNNTFLATFKNLILAQQINLPLGLIVLLISKAGNSGRDFSKMDCGISSGIHHSQKTLAGVTEMLLTSHIIHKVVQNVPESDFPDDRNVNLINKLSILTGHYLLSKSVSELAKLKCNEVSEIMLSCLRDLVDASFIPPRKRLSNICLPAKPQESNKSISIPHQLDSKTIFNIHDILGNAKQEWTLRHLLGGAGMLAKSCQSTLILAKHNKDLQTAGYIFGRNMALAYQANLDYSAILCEENTHFELVCAPLMFHIQENSIFYNKLMENVENDTVDYKEIATEVRSGSGLSQTLKLKDEFTSNALDVLEKFPESMARLALSNLTKSI